MRLERSKARQVEAAGCLADGVAEAIKVGVPEEVVEAVIDPKAAVLE